MKDDKQKEKIAKREEQSAESLEQDVEGEEHVERRAESLEQRDDEVAELHAQVDAWEGKYKRALADYHNLQKRVQDEKSRWIQSSNKELLLRLLPVLDTLMLAKTHLNDQGLLVSVNHFLDILKAEGVIKVKTEGEAFDPHTMECVMTEEGKENQVLEELRAGYLLNGFVLRAAQVKVGRRA